MSHLPGFAIGVERSVTIVDRCPAKAATKGRSARATVSMGRYVSRTTSIRWSHGCIRVKKWFDQMEADGVLEISHSTTTWHSNQMIAHFADSIFDDGWGFEKTTSMNTEATGHDGLFVVRPEHVSAYVSRFDSLCLRHSATQPAIWICRS